MENNADKLTYYIVREKADEPGDPFTILTNDLDHYIDRNNVIQERPGAISVSADSRQKCLIEYNHPEVVKKFPQYQFRARLTLDREDTVNLHVLKLLAVRARVKYRIYSVLYDCFLPINTDLVNIDFGIRDEKLANIFSQFKLKPLFVSHQLGHYYALTDDGKVVIVNKYLIEFMYGKDIPEKSLPDLWYVVADSIKAFGLKYDRWLIPTDFYEYFGKFAKIINNSNFDISNPGKKIFIKPYIFELREEKGEFYQIAGADGQALLMMDKIRPGETLDKALKRIISEELKVSDDYLGAYVSDEVEFDRDRDGVITPRLVVWVYVDKIQKERPKVLQMSQTGWQSMGGTTPKINVSQEFDKAAS